MAAPTVRKLQSIIKEQSQSIQPQLGLIDQSIGQLESSGRAQEAGLAAKQDQAFGQIEQGAQNKGMFFSGFSPAEQANYTSTTYLPELARLQGTIAQGRIDLLGKKADLNKSVFDTSTQIREQDVAVLNDWNKMTAQQKFQASESQKQRVFEAQQNEANRQTQLRTASIGASGGGGDAGPSQQEQFASALASAAGKDGKVSPGNYNALKNQWVAAGYGNFKSFHDKFWKFANQKHWWDYK